MRSRFEKMCRDAQIEITKAIEEIDGEASFQEDAWTRANGGGGMSRVMSNGKVFEKAGVNLSVVYGSMPQEALQAATERGVDRAKGMAPGERVPFFACGLSSVMHPKNPHCPTMHFNYRYFETDGGVWWFGGGTDISEYKKSKERCRGWKTGRHWHVTNCYYSLLFFLNQFDTNYSPKLRQRGRHGSLPRNIQGNLRQARS